MGTIHTPLYYLFALLLNQPGLRRQNKGTVAERYVAECYVPDFGP